MNSYPYHLLNGGDNSKASTIMTEEELKRKSLQVARISTLVIGLIIGAFIQSSTLGINWVVFVKKVKQQNEEGSIEPTKQDALLIYAWSFLVSLMGISVLLLLRYMIYTVAEFDGKTSATRSRCQEEFLCQIFVIVDYYFAFGVMTSVGFTWCITDYLLGMKAAAYQSLIFSALAMILYAVAAAILQRKYKGSQPASKDTSTTSAATTTSSTEIAHLFIA